jgi:hypothetical protein
LSNSWGRSIKVEGRERVDGYKKKNEEEVIIVTCYEQVYTKASKLSSLYFNPSTLPLHDAHKGRHYIWNFPIPHPMHPPGSLLADWDAEGRGCGEWRNVVTSLVGVMEG